MSYHRDAASWARVRLVQDTLLREQETGSKTSKINLARRLGINISTLWSIVRELERKGKLIPSERRQTRHDQKDAELRQRIKAVRQAKIAKFLECGTLRLNDEDLQKALPE